MIDKNKTYMTRDGRQVRIYAVDSGGRLPVHGAVKNQDGWVQEEWSDRGWYIASVDGICTPHKSDLIETKPRINREVWANVYKYSVYTYGSKLSADTASADTRIACVKLVIDCEEGEGL